MKNSSLYISLVALLASASAVFLSVQKAPSEPDQTDAVALVESALKSNPKLVIQAMQDYERIAQEEALAATQKSLDDNIEAINNDPNTPVIGNPNGSIVLVEYFDFACGYCHRVYPAIKNIIAKNPDVKVLGKTLAFVSSASDYAGRAALAANEQGKYTEMYSAIFETKDRLSEDSINAAAQKIGLDMEKFNADVNSEKVKNAMKGFSDLASKIQVNGVPTLILNGKIIQTIDENEIQRRIDEVKSK